MTKRRWGILILLIVVGIGLGIGTIVNQKRLDDQKVHRASNYLADIKEINQQEITTQNIKVNKKQVKQLSDKTKQLLVDNLFNKQEKRNVKNEVAQELTLYNKRSLIFTKEKERVAKDEYLAELSDLEATIIKEFDWQFPPFTVEEIKEVLRIEQKRLADFNYYKQEVQERFTQFEEEVTDYIEAYQLRAHSTNSKVVGFDELPEGTQVAVIANQFDHRLSMVDGGKSMYLWYDIQGNVLIFRIHSGVGNAHPFHKVMLYEDGIELSEIYSRVGDHQDYETNLAKGRQKAELYADYLANQQLYDRVGAAVEVLPEIFSQYIEGTQMSGEK